jgi:peptidoglycan/LPS O-acetylase OafA/YrhL
MQGSLSRNPSNSPDPLDAPPESMPASPLLIDETPPLRPTLLDFNPTKRRMENLDTLRIIAMLVIVLTHVTQPYLDYWVDARPFTTLYQSIFSINVAGRFGVPCFMMISFFIYWHQLYDKNRSWGELLKRRFKRLLPAFICWSLFYFGLHKFLYPRTLSNLPLTLDVIPSPLGDRLNWKDLGVWREILLQGHAHDHLYYLPVILCSLLLIPLLAVLWRRPALAWTWIVATLIAWTIVAYGCSFFPEKSTAGRAVARVMWVWKNFLAIPLLIFPLLGMMSAGQKRWREFIAHSPTSLWVCLLIFGLVLHVAETLCFLEYGTTREAWLQALAGLKVGRFFSAVPIFVLILRYPLMKDPFPRVSHYAFGLHFMHPAIIIGLTIAEAQFMGPKIADWQAWVVPILALNFMLTFFITFGLCLVIGRFKRLEFLVV